MSARPPAGGISKTQKSCAPRIYTNLYNATARAYPNLDGVRLQKKVNEIWSSLQKDEERVVEKIHELNKIAARKKAGLLAFWGNVPKSPQGRESGKSEANANADSSSNSSSSSSSKSHKGPKKRPLVFDRYTGVFVYF